MYYSICIYIVILELIHIINLKSNTLYKPTNVYIVYLTLNFKLHYLISDQLLKELFEITNYNLI